MDTFPIVRRNEESQYGEFRSKRVILEIYDHMQRAIENGQPYKTALNPPPSDPSCRHPKKKTGILGFGSLIGDPGNELKAKIAMRIKRTTPFPVEFGRYSGKTRGGAPTLVPHQQGSPVSAEILVLDDGVTVAAATDMLWRRETRKTGNDETYREGKSDNSVLVRAITNDACVETVLYTDFPAAGKILHPDPAELAVRAIRSAETAREGMDGITYLISAMNSGIETPLTAAYCGEVLRTTNTPSLDEALRRAKEAVVQSPKGDES